LGDADLLRPAIKSERKGKNAIFPLLTNQALTSLIWQPIRGLRGSTE
jgi:hypothetical protein